MNDDPVSQTTDGNAFLKWLEAHAGDWHVSYRDGDAPLWVYEMEFDLRDRPGDLICAAEASGTDEDDPVLQARIDEAERAMSLVRAWVRKAYGT